jgi:hypothetical protein
VGEKHKLIWFAGNVVSIVNRDTCTFYVRFIKRHAHAQHDHVFDKSYERDLSLSLDAYKVRWVLTEQAFNSRYSSVTL